MKPAVMDDAGQGIVRRALQKPALSCSNAANKVSPFSISQNYGAGAAGATDQPKKKNAHATEAAADARAQVMAAR